MIGHIQHLSLESLVKMDHFQKDATAKFKRDHWSTRGSKGAHLKEQIGNPGQTECPLWVISRHFALRLPCPLCANSGQLQTLFDHFVSAL